MTDIVVAGAGGAVGRQLLGELGRPGADFAAVSHTDAGAERLSELGVEDVRVADLADSASLARAFAGARAVHLIPPALHQREHMLAENAIAGAEAAGVERFVYHSVLHPHTPALRNHMRKAAAEHVLRASGLRWTVLQPSIFAQVLLAMFGRVESGAVPVPFNVGKRIAVLDLADLAEVAARALLEDGHDYATYELAGPLTTIATVVAEVGALRGIDVTAVRTPPAEGPLPPAAAQGPMAAADMISTYAHYDEHGFLGNSRILAALLGRAPADFGQVAKRELRGAKAETS